MPQTRGRCIVATAGAAAPLVVPLTETALIEAAVLAGEEALVASAATTVAVEGTAVTVGAAGAGSTTAVAAGTGVGLAVDAAGLAQG